MSERGKGKGGKIGFVLLGAALVGGAVGLAVWAVRKSKRDALAAAYAAWQNKTFGFGSKAGLPFSLSLAGYFPKESCDLVGGTYGEAHPVEGMHNCVVQIGKGPKSFGFEPGVKGTDGFVFIVPEDAQKFRDAGFAVDADNYGTKAYVKIDASGKHRLAKLDDAASKDAPRVIVHTPRDGGDKACLDLGGEVHEDGNDFHACYLRLATFVYEAKK